MDMVVEINAEYPTFSQVDETTGINEEDAEMAGIPLHQSRKHACTPFPLRVATAMEQDKIVIVWTA